MLETHLDDPFDHRLTYIPTVSDHFSFRILEYPSQYLLDGQYRATYNTVFPRKDLKPKNPVIVDWQLRENLKARKPYPPFIVPDCPRIKCLNIIPRIG